jgi:hypothetical protein
LAASGEAAGLNPLYQDFYYRGEKGEKAKTKTQEIFPKLRTNTS